MTAVDLVKSFRRRRVVDGVSLHVERGEVVGLLGPNGAGKTTTFRSMVGMLRPDAGQVLLDDFAVTRLPMYRRARLGIGYLAQEPSVFRRLSVEANLKAVLETLPLSRRALRERLEALLDEYQLQRVRHSLGEALSGGERRRVEIARALVTDPSFMLLDEPMAGIDPIAVAEIQRIIGALAARGIGVLITDHNVRETLSVCDRAYILSEGRILLEGTPAAIANSAVARQTYLGEGFSLGR